MGNPDNSKERIKSLFNFKRVEKQKDLNESS